MRQHEEQNWKPPVHPIPDIAVPDMSAAHIIGDTNKLEGTGPSSPAKLDAAAPQTTDGWFYLLQGQHLGPFTTEELIGMSSPANEVHIGMAN